MSSRASGSNDANWEAPNDGMNGLSRGDSLFETGREFAASRQDYNFEDDDKTFSEDDSGDEADTRDGAEEESRRLMRYSDSPDYYSLLGVPRTPPPTETQIRSAFQRLSLSFHPDKQPLHLRQAAADQYSKIQRAYDTLLDPQKRVVYDLLGEEGVKAEWGAGGTMSKEGLAQQSQVGVRTMTSAEFRQWFLDIMRKRERLMLEDMIGSRGTLFLTFDAVPFFQWINLVPVLEDEPPRSIGIAGIYVGQSFKVPLPWLRSAHSIGFRNSTPFNRIQPDGPNFSRGALKDPALVINLGISGKVLRQKTQSMIKMNASGEEVMKELELPPVLASKQFSLGSKVVYTVPDVPGTVTGFRMKAWRLIQGCGLELGGNVLPDRMFSTVIQRQFTPISGTQPIFARAQATFVYPVHEVPPITSLTLSRGLAPDQQIFCSWSSKQNVWTDFPIRAIVDALHLGTKDDQPYRMIPGSFQIGYGVHPQGPQSDGENDRSEEDQERTEISEKASSKPTWAISVDTSGNSGTLSITYSRDVFGGSKDVPALSSWSGEGYHPQSKKISHEANPVRLQIEMTAGLDRSIGGSFSATRKFGDYTSMGLGVMCADGLVVGKLIWDRLGQNIEIPVVVCPPELFNPDVLKAALVIPWATFLLVEYGILRPRARRKWQKAVEERRNHLTKLVARRRAESAEATELMASQVKRRQTDEKSKDGLFIIHAEYGVRRKDARQKASTKIGDSTDVTIPLAALVHNSQLSLPRRLKKSHILGFHDPAPLSRKTLSVRYRFGGAEHFVEVDENENLMCPMKQHRLSSVHELD